jgi:hypothetical protein
LYSHLFTFVLVEGKFQGVGLVLDIIDLRLNITIPSSGYYLPPYPYLAAIDLLYEGEMFEWSVSSENLLGVL